MKSYNHLWEKFIDEDNIKLAIKNSSNGGKKKKREDVSWVLNHEEWTIRRIKNNISHYKNSEHAPKIIYDGVSRKKRTIIVPTYQEQIVHHMLVNTLKFIFLKGTYEQAYGSIPGRGVHNGKKVIEKWIRSDAKNCKYCLKLDIKKYFENINHDVLKEKSRKIIRDEKFLKVLFEVIDVTEKGLPLGFYTSQWLSMWFLKDFDHHVKEKCYAPHYMRYMDDIVIFGANKRKLWKTYYEIVRYLSEELGGLKLNGKRQRFRFVYEKQDKEYGRDLDFMGFRFFRNRTILRKSIMFKMTRKARKIGKKEKPTIFELRQMMSYMGWIKSCDIYNAFAKYVKPYFSFRKARKRVGKYDKRMVKLCGN